MQNGYKIVSFDPNAIELDGNVLQEVCRDPTNENSVRDMLLWWHFQQAVLANMRGAGEPVFEDDFPPGNDMMGEIREGSKPAERMEFELATRLHPSRLPPNDRENRPPNPQLTPSKNRTESLSPERKSRQQSPAKQ